MNILVVYKKNFEEVHDDGLLTLRKVLQTETADHHHVGDRGAQLLDVVLHCSALTQPALPAREALRRFKPSIEASGRTLQKKSLRACLVKWPQHEWPNGHSKARGDKF